MLIPLSFLGPPGRARQAGARWAAGTSMGELVLGGKWAGCQAPHKCAHMHAQSLGLQTAVLRGCPGQAAPEPSRKFSASNSSHRVFTGGDGRDWGDRTTWLSRKCQTPLISFYKLIFNWSPSVWFLPQKENLCVSLIKCL